MDRQPVLPVPLVLFRTSAAAARALAAVRAHTTSKTGHPLRQLACSVPLGKPTPTPAHCRAPPAPPLPSPQIVVLPCAASALPAPIVLHNPLRAYHVQLAAVALSAVTFRARAKFSSTSPAPAHPPALLVPSPSASSSTQPLVNRRRPPPLPSPSFTSPWSSCSPASPLQLLCSPCV